MLFMVLSSLSSLFTTMGFQLSSLNYDYMETSRSFLEPLSLGRLIALINQSTSSWDQL
jgi:hypothetical protein